MSPDRLFELATASVEAALRLESALDERANLPETNVVQLHLHSTREGIEKGERIIFDANVIPLSEWKDFRAGIEHLIAQRAHEVLPFGERFEIRAAVPRYYGRIHDVGWVSNTAMQIASDWEEGWLPLGELDLDQGYFLRGRFISTGKGAAREAA